MDLTEELAALKKSSKDREKVLKDKLREVRDGSRLHGIEVSWLLRLVLIYRTTCLCPHQRRKPRRSQARHPRNP